MLRTYTFQMRVTKTLFTAAALGGILFVHAALVLAQSSEPRFDVASIKPSVEGRQSLQVRPNGLTASNQSLQLYIGLAHGGGGLQIVGAPEWTAKERFDVIARASSPSGRQAILAMLRTLLAERFGLRTHRESRQADGYALVLASGNRRSPGLRPVNVDCDSTSPPEPGPVQGLFPPEKRPACGSSVVTTRLVSGPVLRIVRYSAITMDRFANGLDGSVGRPVVNRTGLAGTFDIELQYIAEMPAGPGVSAPTSPAPDGVSFRDALKEQLGFELRPERVQVEMLVIDAVDRPAPD